MNSDLSIEPASAQPALCHGSNTVVTLFGGDRYDCIPQAEPQAIPWDALCEWLLESAASAPGLEKDNAGYITTCAFRPATEVEIDQIEADRQQRAKRRQVSCSPFTQEQRLAIRAHGYRIKALVNVVGSIIVDYDGRPTDSPDWRAESWPCEAFAYSSHNWHPTERPGKWRVILRLAEPIPAAEYDCVKAALQPLLPPGAILRWEGQPAYLPTCPAGLNVQFECVSGEPLDWRALLATQPTTPANSTPRAPVVASATQRTEHDAEIVRLLASVWQRGCVGHTALGALGGVLCRANISEDRAEWIANELAAATNSEHHDPVGRALEAFDGLHELGWPTLKERLCENGVGLQGEPNVVRGQISAVLDQVERLILDSVAARTPAPTTPAPTTPAKPTPQEPPTPHERGMDPAVNEVIARLSHPTVGVFQRSGRLCTVVREAKEDGNCIRPVGAPTIRDLAPARLREIIRTMCGQRDVALAGEVMARGEWSYIRPLDAIVTYPIMRRDGSILLENGYDAATRTLAEIDVQVGLPDRPTQADAVAALAALSELVCDFPFVSESQRSAWLAMLLTVPARPAIDGPTPLGLLEASQRASGKTMLADVISMIATGREAPRRVAPKTKEEWDKTMLSILLAGDPVVLLDNVTTMLASDALDSVLTGTTYTQRVLGVSEERCVAIRTVFLASSNNARLSSDLVRRSVACRLAPDVERPETRTGFRHPDLLGHVRAHRSALLGAALVVLRAYAVAGRPQVGARPMGSYAAWCRVVRDALVWAGGSDPAATQDALRESSDVERDELRDLLTAWHSAIGDRAVTAREVLDAARDMAGGEPATALLDALRGITPNGNEPSAHVLGNRLKTKRDQIVDGLALREGKRNRANTVTWQVMQAG